VIPLLLGVAGWELLWWERRRSHRRRLYAKAGVVAQQLGRPLVVVGAPDMGATLGPGCGDITVDIGESRCPVFLQADITRPLPFANDSVVVFVSCVLEYVDDYPAAVAELRRVSGGYCYVARVEPWSLVAYFYPGARRRLPARIAGLEVA